LESSPRQEPVFEQLASGLSVVVVPAPHLTRAHVALYARVGSRFETEADNGISHFLEHMMYRGSEHYRSAHEVTRAFEELGGSLYGVTYVDFGVFSVTVPSANLVAVSDNLASVMRTPAFQEIEIERGIVREEILEDLDEDGREINADNLSRKLIYPKHPLGFSITGSQAQLDKFDSVALHVHHRKHYCAANSVLVYSGAVDTKDCLAAAKRGFGTLETGARVQTEAPVRAQKKPRFKYVANASSQTDLRLCFRSEGEASPDRGPMDMMLRVLDDGMSTRLYRRICDERGLCYDVSAGYDGYEDDGVLDFSASVANERAGEVVSEILRLMKELAEHGPNERELDRARKRAKWDTEGLRDLPEDLGGFHAGSILFARKTTPEARLEENLSVSAEQIRALADKLLAKERLSVVCVGHLANPDALEDSVRSFQ
jgi:predicted Zn-dependent peptidase